MFQGQKTISKGKTTTECSADQAQGKPREYRPGEEMPLPAAETALNFPEKITLWRSSRFLFGRKGYDLHVEYSCMNGTQQ